MSASGIQAYGIPEHVIPEHVIHIFGKIVHSSGLHKVRATIISSQILIPSNPGRHAKKMDAVQTRKESKGISPFLSF